MNGSVGSGRRSENDSLFSQFFAGFQFERECKKCHLVLHSKSEQGLRSNFHKHIKKVHQMTGKSYKVWLMNNSNKSPAAASSAARGSSRQPLNASPPLEKVKNRPAGDSPDGPNG